MPIVQWPGRFTQPRRLTFTACLLISVAAHIRADNGPSALTTTKIAGKETDAATNRDRTALTPATRLDFIRRAQIWMPTDVPAMNLRVGPQGPGAFAPGAVVTCDYVEKKMPGTSRKFACAISLDDVVKVRYGPDNGKVEGEVLASRLLWALGFGADRNYPVRVTCRGCAADPWVHHAKMPGRVVVFDLAMIERKPAGHEMRYKNRKAGWSWRELDVVDEEEGGAPLAQRDALKLLAVFLQHTDSKSVQQRLLCLPGGLTDRGCQRPFLLVHDVGNTFGHANVFNRDAASSVNFDEWAKTPIWREAAACRAHLSKSATGTLDDPVISESGRRFLADLLVQLTDQQIRDLFEVAQVDRRSRKPHSSEPPASIDEWVSAFKAKRGEIVNTRCPS